MPDEMSIMASRGLVKVFINLLLLHHCFPVIYFTLIFHSIFGSGLGSRPEKMA